MSSSEKSIAEIVESTISSFIAQCREIGDNPPRLFDPPDFGSLVKVPPFGSEVRTDHVATAEISTDIDEIDPFESMGMSQLNKAATLSADTFFAVVFWAKMSGMDTGRRPAPHGLTYDQLLSEQPQVFALLTTEFSAMSIAYTDRSGNLRRHLPPRPPRIHSPVSPCRNEEILELTADLRFLQPMLKQGIAGGVAPVEELAAAVIRQGLLVRGNDPGYLHAVGTTLAAILGADFDRLQAIMQSVVG